MQKPNSRYGCGGLVLFLSAVAMIVMGQGRSIRTVEAKAQPAQGERDSNAMVAFHGGTGSYLLPLCQSAVSIANDNKSGPVRPNDVQEHLNASFCSGYVEGVVDTMTGFAALPGSAATYCFPANADNNQLVRIVAKYLNDNPARLNEPAGLLVFKSMVDAFPCR
jgi:hypothetical protein